MRVCASRVLVTEVGRHGASSATYNLYVKMGGATLKNTLLVQFPANTNPSYERVIEIEDALIQAFGQNRAAVVDGHDFGGTANIFIIPNGPWDHCIEVVIAYLKLKKALSEVLVIKRLKSGQYEVVSPKGFTGDFERV